MFRYRLHSPDGDDLGEATYAIMIKPGEEILLGAGRRFRVLDVVQRAGAGEHQLRKGMPAALASVSSLEMANPGQKTSRSDRRPAR